MGPHALGRVDVGAGHIDGHRARRCIDAIDRLHEFLGWSLADQVVALLDELDVTPCLDHLPDTGFNVLNWGKQKDIREVKRRVGSRMCLMGNVNPLEIGVRGTPDEVRAATLDVLEGAGGEGIILSVGGGVSPGMPGQNISAMLDALRDFNSRGRQASERTWSTTLA